MSSHFLPMPFDVPYTFMIIEGIHVTLLDEKPSKTDDDYLQDWDTDKMVRKGIYDIDVPDDWVDGGLYQLIDNKWALIDRLDD